MKKPLILVMLLTSAFALFFNHAYCQGDNSVINLKKIMDNKGIEVVNRKIEIVNDKSRVIVKLSGETGEGIAWIKDSMFSDGSVEFDVKGKDVPGKSFVGIAFFGVDNSTYDAVYLRPFNFKSNEETKRQHSIQYISHPNNTWFKLREGFPNKFENRIEPTPDPNVWNHVRVEIKGGIIKTYINDLKEPSLVVTRLSKQAVGKIGFFVADGSDGEFSNLKIVKDK